MPEYPVLTPSGPRFIDFAYPDRKVAIEIDGWVRHVLDPDGFVRERARQNELEEMGWTFRRFTPSMIRAHPLDVAFTTARAA